MINWIKTKEKFPSAGISVLVYDIDKNDIFICKIVDYGSSKTNNYMWFLFTKQEQASLEHYPIWAELPDDPQEIMELKKYLQNKEISLKIK
jgi:hypothetical protein